MNNAVQLIKLAQKLAIARGKLRGAILLERCFP